MVMLMHLLLVAPFMGLSTRFERLASPGRLSLVQVRAGVKSASTTEADWDPEQTKLMRSNVDLLWQQQEEALQQQQVEEQKARKYRFDAEDRLTRQQQAARSLVLQEEEAHRNRVRAEQDEKFYQAAVTRLADEEAQAKQLIVEASQRLEKTQAEARHAEQEIETLKKNSTENEDAIKNLAAESANLHKLEDFAHNEGQKAEHDKLKEESSAQVWRMKEDEARIAAEEANASIAKLTLEADSLLEVIHEKKKLQNEAQRALESDTKASAEWEQNLTALHSQHEALVTHMRGLDVQAKKELQAEMEARDNAEKALITLKQQEKQIDKLSAQTRSIHERLRKTRDQVEVEQETVRKAHEKEQQTHEKRVNLDREFTRLAKSEQMWKETLASTQANFEVATQKMKETQKEVNHWQEEERSAHEGREAMERQHEAELNAVLEAYSQKKVSKEMKANSTASLKAHKPAEGQTINETKRNATREQSSLGKNNQSSLTAGKGLFSKRVEDCSEHCSEVFGSCFWNQAQQTQNSSKAFSLCLNLRDGGECASGCQLTHEMSTVAERFSGEIVRIMPPGSPEQAPPCTATCSEQFTNVFWAQFRKTGNVTDVFDWCMAGLNEGHQSMLASGCRPGCAITDDMATLAEVFVGTVDDDEEESYCSPSCNEEFGKCVWNQVRSGIAPELGHKQCMNRLKEGTDTSLRQRGCVGDCLPTSFMSALAMVNTNASSGDVALCSTSCSYEFSHCVADRVSMGDAQQRAFARCQRELDAGVGLMADHGCEPGCALTPHMMGLAILQKGAAAKRDEVNARGKTSRKSEDVEPEGNTSRRIKEVKPDGNASKQSDNLKPNGKHAKRIDVNHTGNTFNLVKEVKQKGNTFKRIGEVKPKGNSSKRSEELKPQDNTSESIEEVKPNGSTSQNGAASTSHLKLTGGTVALMKKANPEEAEQVQKQSPKKNCLDVQPPSDWVQNTCEKQRAHTTKCQERRIGALQDGYCAKTCGVCKSTPTKSTVATKVNSEKFFLKRTLVAHEGRNLKTCDKGCTMTVEDCKAACLQTVGCRSFTYSTKRKCFLKAKHVEATDPSHKDAKRKPTWATYYLPNERT